MAYQVLARKWRPKQFEEMVGQEPILRMLSNALQQNRIHHAYLFTGTRGVGKTTLGRIIAKCLNCESGITATPCCQCAFCTAIDAGKFLDLYEIDAASKTKVEDTRDLLDNVLYPPTQGRYKIYLIDEVHMLSNHSFNALLKTLEEPPEHVKFLLATTDPKRIPVTILSRCLQFHLKQITPELITKHLGVICDKEQIKHEAAALAILAKAAKGSMRDALSLLDQAIAYGQGQVSNTEVRAMLGSMLQDDLYPLVQALSAQDGPQLFSIIKTIAENAPDFNQVLEELISLLHQVAIAQVVKELPVNADIKQLAAQISPEDCQVYYQIALLGRRDLPYAPSPQMGFEMTMLRMLAFRPGQAAAIAPLPTKQVRKPVTPIIEEMVVPIKTPEPTVAKENVAPSEVTTLDWRELLPKLELSGMAYALASNCSLTHFANNKVELTLSKNHEPMLNSKLKERISDALTRHLKQPITLDIQITAQELYTPLKQQQQENTDRLNAAKKEVLEDPKLKQLIDMYDATVEVSLIN